jgi:hypothetical protein
MYVSGGVVGDAMIPEKVKATSTRSLPVRPYEPDSL